MESGLNDRVENVPNVGEENARYPDPWTVRTTSQITAVNETTEGADLCSLRASVLQDNNGLEGVEISADRRFSEKCGWLLDPFQRD